MNYIRIELGDIMYFTVLSEGDNNGRLLLPHDLRSSHFLALKKELDKEDEMSDV